MSPAYKMATTKEAVLPKERLGDRLSEAPVIGRVEGDDMLEMALDRAGIAEPPATPVEATAGLAMLRLRRRAATGRRAAGLLFGNAEARAASMA